MKQVFDHMPRARLDLFRYAKASGKMVFRCLLPPRCLGCDAIVADIDGLCATCWQDFPIIERPFCPVLGLPFAFDRGEAYCSEQALRQPPLFGRARAVTLYDGLARRLVSSLKFYDRLDVVNFMGHHMARACHEFAGDVDLFVPVPLHRWRLFGRRFNQSAELCRVLVSKLSSEGYKVDAEMLALTKVKRTRPQVGLDHDARLRNVSGVFAVTSGMETVVFGKRIVLVDDVMTTGATVNTCTKVLLAAGARSVDIVTFATVAGAMHDKV